ncbi:hypothetical protein E6O75_ATG11052 [Venturia nashicola]|uniref:Uncharacterized protein n=1 Tax=Venturia nashicola TaxID=86259 RepID=A0A4Z1P461_9PEZI|nr:hypothetical protein E6O75_ATG11052 [Venturia nashicola]
MNSASTCTRFSELMLNLPVELVQEIFNYYLEAAVPRAIKKDVMFNAKLHLMFQEVYGIDHGTKAVLPNIFELLSLVHCPGNPYVSKYTNRLVQIGFKATEGLKGGIESSFIANKRWARKIEDRNRLAGSNKEFRTVFSACCKKKKAWRAEAFRDWRDDYEYTRRRFVIGNSWGAIMVPQGGDRMRRVLWYAEILCQMKTIPAMSW